MIYYTPIRMVKIKKNSDFNACEDIEKLYHSYISGGTIK